MVANVTNDDILRTLEMIRQQRQSQSPTQNYQSYFKPVTDYKQYMPKTLGYNPPDTGQYYNILDAIKQRGLNANLLQATLSQNKAAYEQMQQAKKEAQAAKQAAKQAANYHPHYTYPGTTVNMSGGGTTGKLPKPGHYGKYDPNAPIKTYHWRNFSLTFNSSVAPRFIAFLKALWKEGYHPKVIGSYRPGSHIYPGGPLDLHSRAMAMDIDPSKNPVTWNGHNITALPANVGALAARYGLKWGGSWIHNKRDTMHFSVPYGGVE